MLLLLLYFLCVAYNSLEKIFNYNPDSTEHLNKRVFPQVKANILEKFLQFIQKNVYKEVIRSIKLISECF